MKVLLDFNLVITTQRGNERNCIRELSRLVGEAGGPRIHMKKTRFPGLLLGFVEGDPIELCRKIRPFVEEDPWDLRFVQKVIPIQKTVPADAASIKEVVSGLAGLIPEKSSFKITVNKRGTEISSMELIKQVATAVQRRVDLNRPDMIIQLELIDDRAGISLIVDDDIVSVTKMQEKAMEGEASKD